MRIRGIATTAAAAAALLAGLTVPAVAASSGSDAAPFAAQAKAAHLTKAQAGSLRAEVARIMAKTGGRQVGLNTIDLNGRGQVLVAVPGEAHPRALPSATAASDPCLTGPVYSGYFCAYSAPNEQGSEIKMYYCQAYGIPWVGNGSWINDQTPGTRARFYRDNGSLLYTTPGPYSYNDNYSTWTNVHTIRPC